MGLFNASIKTKLFVCSARSFIFVLMAVLFTLPAFSRQDKLSNSALLKSEQLQPSFKALKVSCGLIHKNYMNNLIPKQHANGKSNYPIYLILGIAAIAFALLIVCYVKCLANSKLKQALESKIKEAQHDAKKAHNANAAYLTMISHEIRTPMNGVLGMANLLLQSKLDQEQTEYVNTIHHSADSLLKIVNDVLDFSKIEAGKLTLEYLTTNIRTLINDALAALPPIGKDLRINFKITDEVPEFIICDPVRLRQILINLLSNAIKFTPKGFVKLECKLMEFSKENDLNLGFIVTDTGSGIPANKIKELFKPFLQIEKSNIRNYGGSGLGLNITSALIKMMGGHIYVESLIDKGSIFTFNIWAKTAATDKAEVQKEYVVNPVILDRELSTNYPFKLLVVDDNEINLMLITKTLNKLGYDVKQAQNGKAALALIKQNNFDLVFMDMQMPIMDGITATAEIRKFFGNFEYPVVVALTANALGDNRDKCLESGMQDFIAKPFKPAEIEEVIKKWAAKIIEYRERLFKK